MGEWSLKSLGEACPFVYGKALPSASRDEQGTVSVYGSNGVVGKHSEAWVFEPGVIIGRKGSVGEVHFSSGHFWPIDTSFYVVGNSTCDVNFSYYLLKSLDLRNMNSDSAVPGLNRDAAHSLKVLLPPLAEQRAIAGVLGALDDKIESNRRLALIATQVCDLIFVSKASIETRISDVAQVTMGSSPPGDTYNMVGEGLPFYQGVTDFGYLSPIRRVWTTSPVREAAAGETLVSVRAPVGRLNEASERCCIGRGVSAISSHFQTAMYYALRQADAVWAPFEAEGTVFGSINKGDLEGAKIRWVKQEALETLNAELEELHKRVRVLMSETHALRKLRDALLPELLSGRLRVKDAESMMEDV